MKQLVYGVLALFLVLAGGGIVPVTESWGGQLPVNAIQDQVLPDLLGAPVSGSMLDHTRGMGGVSNQSNVDTITSQLQNATADITGSNFSNMITTGAFAGASGIVNVIQNAGNNVVIDNSVQVNLTFH